uniref:Uncharacterized protein n=1 Tax=Fagus sylvatica TaxID=28930 RepID=A0A2N9IWX5_FAGSY
MFFLPRFPHPALPPPQIFFCPASLTPPPTNLPYTVPHAASHQPPSRCHAAPHSFTPQITPSSLSRRRSCRPLCHAADPRSVTPQITPQILSVTPQILAQSRRRSSLSHAAALHYNPILGAGRGDAGRSGSGAGRDKLPRPPGRGGVGVGSPIVGFTKVVL